MKVVILTTALLILKLQAAILINLNLKFTIPRLITHPTDQEPLQTIILTKMFQEGRTTKKTIKSNIMTLKIVHIKNIRQAI
jgi:hypothetical protein